jgi:V/A-type H+-transporting ATPase subunit A
MSTSGTVIGINGNMVSVRADGDVIMNEVGYILVDDKRLKSEVIRIRGDVAQMQVFEITKGIGIGDKVDFSGEMLAVELGPGLLGQVYDGLQNPLPELAEQAGYFLERGIYLDALNRDSTWEFKAQVKVGDKIVGGDCLGTVPEGPFEHKIMVPFNLREEYTVKSVKDDGSYKVTDTIVEAEDSKRNLKSFNMIFEWPVKRPIQLFEERLKPVEPMVSKVRLMDTFFPVAKGGTYCIPGPFGAGKQFFSRLPAVTPRWTW